jgi:ferritin
MQSEKIQDIFNKQINAELYSWYLYLSMASWLDTQGLKGLAHWMRMQAQEEYAHAMKFITFVDECDGRVLLTAIDAPKTEWTSALDVFNDTCEHESKVTGLINKMVDLAIAEKDHAANSFLQWFVNEQVEEEATARELRDKLKLAGDNGAVLFMIDQELGQRPAPAAATAGA